MHLATEIMLLMLSMQLTNVVWREKMGLIGKLSGDDASNIEIIPSFSNDVSIQFEDQCIHIINIDPQFCKPSSPHNYSKLRGCILTIRPTKINWRRWNQKEKGGMGRDIREAWTAPARPISADTRSGTGDCQGVEAPWPLVSAKKDSNNNYKPPKDIKIWVSTRAGEKGARSTGVQKTRDQRPGTGRN